MQPGAGAGSKKEVRSRSRFKHVGKIFGPHLAVGPCVHGVWPRYLTRDFGGKFGLIFMVYGRGIAPVVMEIGLDAVSEGVPFDNLLHPAL